MTKISLTVRDFDTLVLCAFRYALGRKTYVTEEISSLIREYEDKISPWVKERIALEINYAIINNNYGMKMDKDEWIKLLEHLGK